MSSQEQINSAGSENLGSCSPRPLVPIFHRPASGQSVDKFYSELTDYVGEEYGPTYRVPTAYGNVPALNIVTAKDLDSYNRPQILRAYGNPRRQQDIAHCVPSLIRPRHDVTFDMATLQKTRRGGTVIELHIEEGSVSKRINVERTKLMYASGLLTDGTVRMAWESRTPTVRALYMESTATDMQIFEAHQWVQERLPLQGVTLEAVPLLLDK